MSAITMSSSKQQGKNQRWYDRRPQVARSITLLEAFPPVIQTIIANGIVDIANRECNASQLINSYKSLGTEKIMGLHKSKNKARQLDSNPATHKAVSYLYVLSEENQDFMARQILELREFIGQYVRHCDTLDHNPDEKEVMALTDTYVAHGKTQAQEFLEKLETVFKEKLQNASTESKTPINKKTPSPQSQEDIWEDTGGMRIRD